MNDYNNWPKAVAGQELASKGFIRHYRLFGLNISSEWEIPGLRRGNPDLPVDVQITRGWVDFPVAKPMPGYHHMEGGAAVLFIPKVARYEIRFGNQIVIDSEHGTSARNINLYLLGSAFGALLHQREALPLHANAVEIKGSAVAFIGPSGAGTSTLAAWFHDRGYPVLADDICVVGFVGEGPVVYPGIPRLRLWREALERSGRTANEHEMSFDDYEKYDVRTRQAVGSDPLPLRAIYGLSAAPSSDLQITRLKGVKAVDLLASNTYRGGFLTSPEQRQRHFNQCLAVAARAAIFSAQRTFDLAMFENVSCQLEAHALQAKAPGMSSAGSILGGTVG